MSTKSVDKREFSRQRRDQPPGMPKWFFKCGSTWKKFSYNFVIVVAPPWKIVSWQCHDKTPGWFLAHPGELMRSRGVRRASSVSRACFATAEGLDLKLGTYDPFQENSYQTKFRSELILGLATRGPNAKSEKVQLPLNKSFNLHQNFMAGVSR